MLMKGSDDFVLDRSGLLLHQRSDFLAIPGYVPMRIHIRHVSNALDQS